MFKSLAAGLLLALTAPLCGAGSADESIYALSVKLVDQDGRSLAFDADRGHPVLISMFYASCGFVCPTLIANIQHMESELGSESRARLRVLMISIDPENDTPAALKDLADKHHADTTRWTFARAEPADVRKIAALLGVQYRKLPNGVYNHSVLVTLIDADGKVQSRSAKLSGANEDFVQALRAATAARPAPAAP